MKVTAAAAMHVWLLRHSRGGKTLLKMSQSPHQERTKHQGNLFFLVNKNPILLEGSSHYEPIASLLHCREQVRSYTWKNLNILWKLNISNTAGCISGWYLEHSLIKLGTWEQDWLTWLSFMAPLGPALSVQGQNDSAKFSFLPIINSSFNKQRNPLKHKPLKLLHFYPWFGSILSLWLIRNNKLNNNRK